LSENNLSTEKILEQSLELNKIQADLLKERGKNQRAPWIALVIVTAAMVAIVVSMLLFFNQYEFYTETITMDTNEGAGNNVYFPGDQAQYHQFPDKGGINGENDS